MNRKTCTFALIVLMAIIMIPGAHAYPIENMVITKNLSENMVAGNSYEMIIEFDNTAKQSIDLIVEMIVTSDYSIGPNEVFVDMWLNGVSIATNMDVAGSFTTGGSVDDSSHNELITIIRTAINLMPGTYELDIGLFGEEIEPEPTPSGAGGYSNKKPKADAGMNQTVYIDETVFFDGSGSYDPDGTIRSWSWNFGDGETTSGETTSHTYSMPGNYTVTLTVKDWRNAEASDSCVVTVIEETEPLIIPPLPPILSNLIITPEEIELGEEVTIQLLVENIDSQSITYIVTMRIEELTLLEEVELEAYEAKTVSQTLTPEAEGTYWVTVDGMTGSFTVFITPPPEPAEFIISNLMVSPSEVQEGEEVTVSVTITNIGETPGIHTLEITVDGDRPEGPSMETTLEGGASATVTVNVIEAPGEHTVNVDGLTGGFTVTAEEDGFPVWIGVLVLVIIAAGVYVLYRRRN